MKIPATCCALMDQDVDRFTDSLGPCFAMLFHDDDDGGGQHHIVNKVDIPQEIDVGGEMSGSGSPSGSLSQDMTDEDGDGQHLIVKVDIPQEIDVDDEMSGSGSPSGSPTQDMPVFEYSYVLSGNHYEDQGHKVILYTQITENCTEHLCSSTNLSAVKRNWPKQDVALIISNKAVLFLKGSLVTRVMPSFYIFLFIISLPLNALALLTFTCRIKEKKPAVIFMSNLACVDLLLTLLLPLKIHYHLNGSHWVFGEAACRVLTSAFYCYMYCSILLMMCMSVDRLMAVVFPIASLTWRSKRNSVYVSALVWLLAFAGTTPLLSITQAVKTMNVGVTCHDVMHHDDPADQTYEYLFSILSCLYFFLPLVVTLASYCTIIYSLSTKSGRLATSSSSTLARQRRAVIMTIAVLTEFVVCFAPTNVILLYHCVLLATGGVGREGNTSYMAYMLALCAGCSSVFLDPLLYYYGSSQCRQQIRSVLRRTKRTKKISSTQSHVSV
ncbi:proteinase-activated receptor 1-like isoform X1 [Triplophysa dalaica]|uniref:proteinase-activated receptor 1-like isoform X1 n=1 Tax=Triplophysa dalaica TaxID=1582913 RepID=UPI0024DF4BEE|nr:proteinase-activated receptor 1-like isoform X1 [Triplophysa dalaica]XP_056588093.1 proteinase-activated receptor 1-like isoform X1 [Triplophysa dalaica]XP_056588094.1 proteinase-activated receptor 1-like isoform X1 [Triplophysa dalaica]XP_056588095.1 proteinase-activated receptor 1-like isoform X1 [Triplophysa dalaica]XP_056588096.1 proteinase-activated receptor 1-like isoform X1 [Triplophysa dalaica]XP_056588097.1 proteinase-activated receptor 1-like isoform X1 [Triplophysa dalaica]